MKTIYSLLKKPVFLKGKLDWISELPSVNRQYNNTVHSSTKTSPIHASQKSNKRNVYSNLQDKSD